MKKVCFVATCVLTMCLIAGVCRCAEKGKRIKLFNGKDLSGWELRNEKGRQSWSAVNGVLHNESSNDNRGTDLCSEKKFGDCELHIEFNVPSGGNSGVYLQGRYEVQVGDSFRSSRLSTGMCGAIYGKISPRVNACKPAGEWQTYDIIFRQARVRDGKVVEKARITVIQNGKKIIDDKEIDGVTGGAIDREEGTPGPLMLQGDHSSVEYRNILIRPLGRRT